MSKSFKNKNAGRNRGYAMLIAMLLTGIILSIGLSLLNIINKELVLSSTGRESRFAFYSADSGVECVLYWDIQHGGFPESVFVISGDSIPFSGSALCNGYDIASNWTVTGDTTSAQTSFDLPLTNDRCARVLVEKTNDGANTKIESRGYNKGCSLDDPLLVERALRVTY